MRAFWDWLAMGGYSTYVWSAYGLAVLVLGLNVWAMNLQKNRVRQQLRQWFNR